MHKLGSTISNIESLCGNAFYKPSDTLKNSDLIILKAIAMSKFEQFYKSNCLYYLQSSNFKTYFMFTNNSMISNYIT